MRITYACPACDATVTRAGVESLAALACPACGATLPVPHDGIGLPAAAGDAAGRRPPVLRRCLVCASTELFVRKDFPQRLGLAIVVAGFVASCVTWAWRLLVPTFAILFATALLDVVLYLVMPECLCCYRCGARYRGAAGPFGGFDLETHEKHRQHRLRAGAPAGAAPASRSP